MKIILDPTHEIHTLLEVGNRILEFPHAQRDSGKALIRALVKVKISGTDELCVVLGPGNFTAIRSACVIGNTIQFLTGCQLFARKKSEKKFKRVKSLRPFYTNPPKITSPKK